MTVVLPVPAMCSTSDHEGSRAPRHGASVLPEGSSQRRRELAECLALSLALHAALVLWASVHSPGLVEPAADEGVELEAPTFTIASILSRPPLEEPTLVASLAEETPPVAEEPPPSPPVLDGSDSQIEPVPILVAAPPPATEQAVPATPAPPPSAPPRAEIPGEPLLAASSPPPPPAEDPRADEPDAEVEVAPEEQVALEAVDEPPPAGDSAVEVEEAQPREQGTPDGRAAEAPPVEPATELPVRESVPALADPEPAVARQGVTEEPELELPAARVEGTGSGGAAPEALVPLAPPRPAEPPRAKPAEGRTFESCLQDEGLMAQARAELSEGARKGLTTVLLAAPEDQLEIARYFSEELVLVPRTTLAAGVAPRYYRLATAGSRGVEVVPSAPPLEGHRQYRDLFDYEYARLPASLRDLRRTVPAREDVYLFAALLSPPEWALVIARRQEALARTGRDLASVRQFVLRYVRVPGGFDLRVVEIVFSDGTRVRSGETEQGAR